MNNLSGKVLGNRYILLEKIGEGGMALVYKARCQLLNRYVAVKILRPEFTMDEEFIKKFRRESLAAASLSHPNIVGIYDVGEEDGIYYIVMEYVQGQTLKEYINKNGKLKYDETLRIVGQIAMALENAHKNGIVHRDIKPHNILITDDHIVKVTDFGIARASSSITMTNTGTVMGSVHYFSPEQARGGFIDHRTDIYSLGVVMYEMITGKLPYDAESPVTVAIKHIQESLIEPTGHDPSIPKAVNDIVLRAMEKDTSKRYQSAREMINDINKALASPNSQLYTSPVVDEKTRIIPVEEIDKAIEKEKGKAKRKSKSSLALKIALGVLTFCIIGGATYFAFSKLLVVKDTVVPKLVGLKEEEARKALVDSKLKIEVENEENVDVPAGEVIRVNPEEGTTVKENSIVTVIISSGKKMVKVPDVTNQDINFANSMMEQYKLKMGKIEYKNSDTVKNDLIIEQNPPANTEVEEGTEVSISISKGPEIRNTTVPILIGRTRADAEKALKDYKLILGSISYDSNSKYINDVVIAQDISGGKEVREGTIINITINRIETESGEGSTTGQEGQDNQNNQGTQGNQ